MVKYCCICTTVFEFSSAWTVKKAIFVVTLIRVISLSSSCNATYFIIRSGCHVTSPIVKTVAGLRSSVTACVLSCQGECQAVSYNSNDQICHTHDKPINAQEVTYEMSPDWKYVQIQKDLVWYDDWVLVFRATPRINQSAYDTWLNFSRYDDHPALRYDVPVGCLGIHGSRYCDRHFKSKVINDWNSYNIIEVKIVLYENGTAKESITFNGKSSTSTTWFAAARMMSSSWTDIIGKTFNYFSQEGDAWIFRRWFVNEFYNGCENDEGWMIVLDKNVSTCPWEARAKEGFPVFLYAPNHKKTAWHSEDYGEADVMAVFVKFG